ncbi:MAG: polysaccharide pyruvyl transferase family protein, partial [Verrucomicrobiae bacterium]|nr:polysaccharide pyruvyl transferase family protein [Verrucomicrobiae bacterium]
MYSRRQFLTLLAGALASGCAAGSKKNRKPRILLCSSWQTVNIGDIAHTPGFLTLMERYLPEVETTLWPRDIGQGVEQKLVDRFPNLKIVNSEADRLQAFEECDFFVHGSAAAVSAIAQIDQWTQETGKGFGSYGITFDDHQSWVLQPDTPEQLQTKVSVLNRAEFVFFRDSESMELAKKLGCTTPVVGFAPDAAFACDVRDDAKADAFLDANDLESGQFLCCIAKLRYAPYWQMKENYPVDPGKQQVNAQFKEQDNAPLLKAVKRVVNETDLKVLLCPEDMSEMAVNKEMIYDRLTAAEKKRVVWKEDYWLVGEAISTYRRCAGLFTLQMHSPIMCIGHGIPAIICRLEQQTSKGIMWKDIGLEEWKLEFDRPEERERL